MNTKNFNQLEFIVTIDQQTWNLPWGSSEREVMIFLEPIVQELGERLGLIPFQFSIEPADKGWVIIGLRKRKYLGHVQPAIRQE